MDPYRVERLVYDVVRFSRTVDTLRLIPLKTDQIKRVVHEMEHVLLTDEEQFWEGRDPAVYLAHLDTATGGWHKL